MKRYITFLFFLLSLFSCRENRIESKVSLENPYYDRAWYLLDHNLPDSSFIYFNKAKEKSLKDGDSVKVAKSLINMAIISGDRGDFFGSQEISLSAIKYLNPGNDSEREILSTNYNNLGKMANRLKHHEEADQFYRQSIALSNKESSRNIYLNNQAVNLIDQQKYADALKYFRKLITTKSIKEDPVTFSRILSNTAKTKWLQNPEYNPVPDFLKALHIRQKQNDLLGQNASLAHLADFYLETKPDSAIFYAKGMYQMARRINIADDQLYALERLIKLSPHQELKQYFEKYKKIKDSVEIDRNAAKNQFALIRYETEKNKADNLNLQKENAEKRYQIDKQRLILIGTLVSIIAGVIILALWYKKRKQKLASEAAAAIRDNQLKIHKRVHDVVANGLYRMMSEIENREDLDRDHILDGIEVLYEKSRDITYEESLTSESNFQERINSLMVSFSAHDRRISLVGNDEYMWDQVSQKAKHEVEHILQELMVNMKKHSHAKNVVVKFERVEKQVNIHYTDDGIGIKGIPNFKNGLTNTGNRIGNIDGKITFDSKNDGGLRIYISFPIT